MKAFWNDIFYRCDCFKDFFYLSSYFFICFLSTSVIVNFSFLFNQFLFFKKDLPPFMALKVFQILFFWLVPVDWFLALTGSSWIQLQFSTSRGSNRNENWKKKRKKDGWKFFGLVVVGGGSSSDSNCSRTNSVLSAGERWEPLQICQVKNLLIFLNIGTRPLSLKLKFHGIALSQGTTCSE